MEEGVVVFRSDLGEERKRKLQSREKVSEE
jgi:hypothetical protein